MIARLPFLLLLGAALLMALLSLPARAGKACVALALSSAEPPYQEAAQVIRATLPSDCPATEIDLQALKSLSATALAENRLIVAIGSQAAQALARLDIPRPVLHILLPAATYDRLPRPRAEGAQMSGIFIDQTPERQIALLRLALPEWKRVALISGTNSSALARGLAESAAASQLQVQSTSILSSDELYPALQQVLTEPAALFALPDPAIFNSYTIQNILLTTYRKQSPVIGFSAAYVRAGALLGLYSTPTQIGTQAAAQVARVLRGERLLPPAHPTRFEVDINRNVARSLGMDIKPGIQLAAELLSQERGAP
jgi:ABC-type uncharacterized transport system substrate-binding protein